MTDDGSCPNLNAMHGHITMKECSQTLNCMHDKQATVQCYENHAQDSRVNPIEVSDTRNQKDGTGGNNLPLVCFSKVSHPTAPNGEGERWDEREVAQTRNTFDNGEKRCQEVVVSTQGLDGYNQQLTGDVSPTCRAKNADTDHLPLIVSTNSNGEDVAPTISQSEYRMGQNQKDTGGVCDYPNGEGRSGM